MGDAAQGQDDDSMGNDPGSPAPGPSTFPPDDEETDDEMSMRTGDKRTAETSISPRILRRRDAAGKTAARSNKPVQKRRRLTTPPIDEEDFMNLIEEPIQGADRGLHLSK